MAGDDDPPTDQSLLVCKAERHTLKKKAEPVMKQLQQLMSQDPGDDDSGIERCVDLLVSFQQKIDPLDKQLFASIRNEKALLQEVEKATDFFQSTEEHIVTGRRLLQKRKEYRAEKKQEAKDAARSSTGNTASSTGKSIKLGKLELPRFGGDALKWREFWDSFQASVHDRTEISAIEKFTFLKNHLDDEALLMVQGYSLTAANYDTVIEALAKRYGDPEIAIFAHLNAMITMPIAGNTLEELQRTFDECERHIRSLVVLGLPEDTFGKVFTPILLARLPHFLRMDLHRRNGSQAMTLDRLRSFFQDELYVRRMSKKVLGDHKGFGGNGKSQTRKPESKQTGGSASALVASESGRKQKVLFPCAFCKKKDHWPDECKTHTTVAARMKVLGSGCEKCLRSNHSASDCRVAARTCPYCDAKGTHHRSLCPKQFGGNQQPGKATGLSVFATEFVPATSFVADTVASKVSQLRGLPVMQTALVTIKGPNGSECVRAILDTASSRSFCRKDVLEKIGGKPLQVENLGIGGIEAEQRRYSQSGCYEVEIVDGRGYSLHLLVSCLETISCPIDRYFIDPNDFPILSSFQLADPLPVSDEEVQIDVLIGLDQYYNVVGPERIDLGRGIVVLGTRFGYVAGGSLKSENERSSGSNSTALAMLASAGNPDDELEANLERLWKLEDVGLKDPKEDDADTIASQQFEQSIGFDSKEKRYMVKWPWKSDEPELPKNFSLSLGRLRSLLSRTSPDVLQTYDTTIHDQMDKGIIERVPDGSTGKLEYYLPHHCILKPDRATTKLRIVYDASSKPSKAYHSLNQCLYRGPVLLADLCGMLMRLRLSKVGVISDVEKAFLQVGLQPEERDVTRFLWVKDLTKPASGSNLLTFRFCRVLFGVVSSPYMLAGTIKHHLEKTKSPVSTEILRNIYIDNVAVGRQDTESALQYYREAKMLFATASMNLRQWQSNDAEFIARLPEVDRGDTKTACVLGIRWNLGDDLWSSAVGGSGSTCQTKRSMLKAVAKLFDPCGYLGPVYIRGKMIIQQLWLSKYDWDCTVPQELQNRWDAFAQELWQLPSVSFPRYVGADVADADRAELHCFCDASEKAYCAAVYLRLVKGSTATVSLLFAKSRVSPVKVQKLTIPRLELTAAAMGARVVAYVASEIALQVTTYLWTDSQCTLHWIQGRAVQPVFVKNRVEKIAQQSGLIVRYVPTKMNPADLATRGLTTAELKAAELWWKGPKFLQGTETDWPETVPVKQAPEPELDEQVSVLQAQAVDECSIDPAKFSSWNRLLRVTAWIYRFVENLRAKVKDCVPYREAKMLFATASMNLRQWQSNDAEFIARLPEVDRGDTKTACVLGIRWNLGDDLWSSAVGGSGSTCRTKRSMLKAVAKLFDPCGYLGPVYIRGKMIIQQLWLSKYDWDCTVPQELQNRWDAFAQELWQLPSVSFPRYVGADVAEADRAELHCFCDASEKAYCAAVYLRLVKGSTATVSLLFAKSRVSPVKVQKLTIPRLELTAAAMGARVVAYVASEIALQVTTYLWTDSQCTLHWIQGRAVQPVFVKNRVEKIAQQSGLIVRYVPTKMNPADLATRGLTTAELKAAELWWKGPKFLQGTETDWPETVPVKQAPEPELDEH
jgi:hypothetical protein